MYSGVRIDEPLGCCNARTSLLIAEIITDSESLQSEALLETAVQTGNCVSPQLEINQSCPTSRKKHKCLQSATSKLMLEESWKPPYSYGHISLKVPNVEFDFDVSVAKHRYKTWKSK